MAAFGAKYLSFAPIKEEAEDALPTYEKNGAFSLGGLVKADLTVNFASGELYADDKLQEKLDEFASGTISAEVDDLEDEKAAKIYGAAIDEDGEKTDNSGDTVPAGGLTYCRTLLRNGKRFYRGYYYPKVKAQIGSDSAATKSASITFASSPITFTVMEASNGDWRKTEEFEKEADAKAWCEEKLANTME
jgi:phi13 family phage major tail protein